MIYTKIIDDLTARIVKACDVTPGQAMNLIMICMAFPENVVPHFSGTGSERMDKAVRIIVEDNGFKAMRDEVYSVCVERKEDSE
jgi:hypothetical protein